MSLSNINTILSEEIKRIQCIMETSRTERYGLHFATFMFMHFKSMYNLEDVDGL